MFVDLDWPLNASSPLSASAELLVKVNNGEHAFVAQTRCWSLMK